VVDQDGHHAVAVHLHQPLRGDICGCNAAGAASAADGKHHCWRTIARRLSHKQWSPGRVSGLQGAAEAWQGSALQGACACGDNPIQHEHSKHSPRFWKALFVGSSTVPGPVPSGSRYVALSRVISDTVDVQLGLSVTAATMSARVQLSGCEQCNETLS
jgi:hypothetical protein